MNTCNCNHNNPHQTLSAALESARREHPTWYYLFDEVSNLAVARSADESLALELSMTAPNELLRGYTLGLFINN